MTRFPTRIGHPAAPGAFRPLFAGQFSTFQDWVNKASSWIGCGKSVCIDAKGRRCLNGGDMMRARDEGAFPVRFFWECVPEDAPAEVQRLEAYQSDVAAWMLDCFGPEISADTVERNHRFLEEALELVQANGCTRSEAHQLVDYVFARPVGEPHQEAGGVMVTLAALCQAADLQLHRAAEDELARISAPETMARIRAKQAAKPKHSPLPVASEDAGGADPEDPADA